MAEAAKADPKNPVLSLASVFEFDNMAADRQFGVCPIPLYEFGDQDFEVMAEGKELDRIQARLKQLDIFQYFFPPPDRVALGLAELGKASGSDIVDAIEKSPKLGHPLGDAELLPSFSSLRELVEDMKDVGYLVEGERVVEITPNGQTIRNTTKYRPAESFLTKLLNRFSVSISASPKDLLPPGH